MPRTGTVTTVDHDRDQSAVAQPEKNWNEAGKRCFVDSLIGRRESRPALAAGKEGLRVLPRAWSLAENHPALARAGARGMRCIGFTAQMGRTGKVPGGGVRLSVLGLRRDPHGSVKQIHHEELEDGDKERPSAFPKIMLKQTDSGIQQLHGAGERTQDQQRRRRLLVDRPQCEQSQRNCARRRVHRQ